LIRSTIANSRALLLGALVAAGALASPASAQTSSADSALAEALFRDARKLMGEGRYAEACPKLAESQRLDPGGGTLLNLALCHAGEGKSATAWVELREALGAARRDGRSDREQIAQKSLDGLEGKLSMLTVQVSDEARAASVTVTLDGAPLGQAAWGTAFPVDPGEHRVEAIAPRHRAFRTTFTVGTTRDSRKVVIPALEEGSEGAGPGTAGGTSRQKTAGYIVGGVGLAAVVVGAAFGVRAITQENEAEKTCSDTVCNDVHGLNASRDAAKAATLSNVGFGVGLGGVAVGVVLVLTAKKPSEKAMAGELVPSFGREGGGLGWRVRW
jgi:hypothetical protein